MRSKGWVSRILTASAENSIQSRYTPAEIDFLVAYVFHLDSWYIFPVSVIGNHHAFYITPGSKKSRHESHREAWDLMRVGSVQPAGPNSPLTADACPARN